MKPFLSELKTAVLLTAVFVILLCGVYPLAVWAGGQLLFKDKANGSLLVDPDGTVRGSQLLAQNFSRPGYFHARPSAAGAGYDGTASSGTNLGPTSAKLINGVHAKDTTGKEVNDLGNFDGIKDLVTAYRLENELKETDPVPADAVTRSASGLDPHISVGNAELQLPRVAKARRANVEELRALLVQHTAPRDLGFLGEPGVNVLTLNREIDRRWP